jgi:hypothetical protein
MNCFRRLSHALRDNLPSAQRDLPSSIFLVPQQRNDLPSVSDLPSRRRSSLFPARSAIVLFLILVLTTSCGGPEEKKMKFYNKGKALPSVPI